MKLSKKIKQNKKILRSFNIWTKKPLNVLQNDLLPSTFFVFAKLSVKHEFCGKFVHKVCYLFENCHQRFVDTKYNFSGNPYENIYLMGCITMIIK